MEQPPEAVSLTGYLARISSQNHSSLDPVDHIIEGDHEENAIMNIIIVSILLFCIFIAYMMVSRKLNKYIPESGAYMVVGMVIGLVLRFSKLQKYQEQLIFQPEAFYFLLLPPIIFEAGYTMNKKNFFLNMGSILLFAIVGTFISTFAVGYSLYGFAKLGILNLDWQHPLESLLFGALISATDPVATLSIMGSAELHANPLVYSLIFGESVLNDAVSIVLFRSFSSYSDAAAFTGGDLLESLGKFAIVCLGSLAVGLAIGLISAAFVKHAKHLRDHPHYEIACMLLFAYSSYLLSELCQLSGVMSLFLTGVVMKHYNWYQLSEQAQVSTYHLFKTVAFMAEAFVFLYLGVSVTGLSPDLKWDPAMIFTSLVVVLVARAANIFPLALLANLRRKKKITWRMQVMQWFAGLRGAVAFALALNVKTPHRSVLVTTTLFIVLFTTLVMGSFTSPVLKKLGLQEIPVQDEAAEGLLMTPIDDEEAPSNGTHNNHAEDEVEEYLRKRKNSHANSDVSPKQVSWIHRQWRLIDEKFLKPMFGGKPRAGYRVA